MRYDRPRASLDRHATYVVAAYLPEPPGSQSGRMRPPARPGSPGGRTARRLPRGQAILSCSSPKSAMSLRMPPGLETQRFKASAPEPPDCEDEPTSTGSPAEPSASAVPGGASLVPYQATFAQSAMGRSRSS
jgi:hypothetical protein